MARTEHFHEHTAGELLDCIDRPMSRLNEAYNRMLDASHDSAAQWERLKRVGGQRDDAAGALLANVQKELRALIALAQIADKLLTETIDNPFAE